MGAATAVSAGIGAVGGAVKFFEGRKMQREAQNNIDNFQWQKLDNPYENLTVSTMGADLQREEAGRTNAAAVESLRASGTRGLVAGLGRLQEQDNLRNRGIAADLDKQQKDIDYARAQDQTRIQAMTENRQSNELAGYGNLLDVGRDMKMGGITDLMSAAGTAASMAGGGAGKSVGGGTGVSPTTFDSSRLDGKYNI